MAIGGDEFIFDFGCDARSMIDRDQAIRQEKVDVLMIGGAILCQVDLFEMKRDVIAKCPIQAQTFIALMGK